MSKFRTMYDKLPDIFTNPGSEEYITYSSDDKGRPIVSGISNIQNEIQSHKESVELATLMQRYANGDETALNQVQGVYADVSGIKPGQSFQDVIEQVKQAEDDFNKLPSELKKLFDNSSTKFWSSFGSEDFNKKIDGYRTSRTSGKGKSVGSDNVNNSQNSGGDSE